MRDEVERIRTAVARAISRAMKEIQRVHPEAHAHLVESLTAPAGSAPSYSPKTDMRWVVAAPDGAS